MTTMLPPSKWTILTSEVKSPIPVDDGHEALIGRVRAEYREMPGLCLTVPQACRLWQIDAPVCASILETLVGDGVLSRTPRGEFTSANNLSRGIR